MSRIGDEGRRHYLYSTWASIKQRCSNPNNPDYANYGGLGISYDLAWEKFVPFRDYILTQLGERPDGFSLDRIDNAGGYFSGNVRWADRETQANNKRNSRKKKAA
jgi:hypothetical protein